MEAPTVNEPRLEIAPYDEIKEEIPPVLNRKIIKSFGEMTVAWGAFEFSMTALLSSQISSNQHATSIILANMNARDKIRALQSITKLITDTGERKSEARAFKALLEHTDPIRIVRNTVAHNILSGVGKGKYARTLYFSPFKFLSNGSSPKNDYFYKIPLDTIIYASERLNFITKLSLDFARKSLPESSP